MTLDEIFDHGKQAAKYLFKEQGEVQPMWITETKNGELIPIMVPMTGNKDDLAAVLKMSLKKLGVVRYVSIIEAWTLQPLEELPESIRRGAPISQHPDRREAVWVAAEDNKGGFKSGMFYILRPENGMPKLSAFKEFDQADNQEGRFVGLLQ